MDYRDTFRRNVRRKLQSIRTTNPVYLSFDDVEDFEIGLVIFGVFIVTDEFQGMTKHRREHLVMDLLREELANSMMTALVLRTVAEHRADKPNWTPGDALVPDQEPGGERESTDERKKKSRKKKSRKRAHKNVSNPAAE